MTENNEPDSDFCGGRNVKARMQLKRIQVTKDFSEYIKRNFSENTKVEAKTQWNLIHVSFSS